MPGSAETPTDTAARRTATATVWIAIFTVMLAVVNVITLYEVIEGGADTHALAVAAGKQADAATALAHQAKAQTGEIHDLAVAAEKQAQQAKRSSQIAARTLGVLEMQQRAWVALAASPVLQPTGNGVIWSLRNYGGSTAFHITAKGELVADPSDISATQDRMCREIEGSQIWELLFSRITGRPRAAFAVGAPIHYVVGCIRYRDQFSASRWTKFCYEPDARDRNAFIACPGNNYTDADKQNPN
jgi:hypothetical protein